MYAFKHVYEWILACIYVMRIIENLYAYCINVNVFEDITVNKCVYVYIYNDSMNVCLFVYE